MYLFYNLGPGRSPLQVARELRGMAAMRPRVIGLVEAIGYPLPVEALGGPSRWPSLDDYWLVRDDSRPGRANVAAYVRRDLQLRWVKWHDLTETWGRTERPGTHPARSILELRVNAHQVLVHHQAPQGTDNTRAAQQEGILALEAIMAPWKRQPWRLHARSRPRVLLWDANRRPGEPGPGPDSLALRIGGTVYGDKIDGAVTRRQPAVRAFYRTRVVGTALRSDHPWGAFQMVTTP